MFASVLQLIGGALALVGTFLVANIYLNVPTLSKPHALISALKRGHTAKQIADGFDLTVETKKRILIVLQGLAFIALGFVLQAVGMVIAIIKHP